MEKREVGCGGREAGGGLVGSREEVGNSGLMETGWLAESG